MLFGVGNALAGYFVARDRFAHLAVKEFFCKPDVRAVEEHQYHAVQRLSVVVHGLDDVLYFVFREHAYAIADNLCKAHDDVQRSAYLVCRILDEGRLLAVSLLCQLGGSCQFFVAAQHLLVGLLDGIDVCVQRCQHSSKAVLKASNHVGTFAMCYLLVVMAGSNQFRLVEQLLQGADGMADGKAAEQHNGNQTCSS